MLPVIRTMLCEPRRRYATDQGSSWTLAHCALIGDLRDLTVSWNVLTLFCRCDSDSHSDNDRHEALPPVY